MLLYQNNTARLFDLHSGQEKTDTWLTDRFAQARQVPALGNVKTFVTDDLDHLVVSPHAIWNEGFGAKMHKTFDFEGKTLSRAEWFLCADRPEPSLGLVHRKPNEQDFLHEAPDAALTIDRQLILMHATKNAIWLYHRDGTVAFHSEAKVPTGWNNGALGMRHLVDEGKLVFFVVDLEHMNVDQVMDRHVALNVWDYRRDVVTSDEVPISELFREVAGHYVLRVSATPVK